MTTIPPTNDPSSTTTSSSSIGGPIRRRRPPPSAPPLSTLHRLLSEPPSYAHAACCSFSGLLHASPARRVGQTQSGATSNASGYVIKRNDSATAPGTPSTPGGGASKSSTPTAASTTTQPLSYHAEQAYLHDGLAFLHVLSRTLRMPLKVYSDAAIQFLKYSAIFPVQKQPFILTQIPDEEKTPGSAASPAATSYIHLDSNYNVGNLVSSSPPLSLYLLATSSLFLSSKALDTPRKLNDFVDAYLAITAVIQRIRKSKEREWSRMKKSSTTQHFDKVKSLWKEFHLTSNATVANQTTTQTFDPANLYIAATTNATIPSGFNPLTCSFPSSASNFVASNEWTFIRSSLIYVEFVILTYATEFTFNNALTVMEEGFGGSPFGAVQRLVLELTEPLPTYESDAISSSPSSVCPLAPYPSPALATRFSKLAWILTHASVRSSIYLHTNIYIIALAIVYLTAQRFQKPAIRINGNTNPLLPTRTPSSSNPSLSRSSSSLQLPEESSPSMSEEVVSTSKEDVVMADIPTQVTVTKTGETTPIDTVTSTTETTAPQTDVPMTDSSTELSASSIPIVTSTLNPEEKKDEAPMEIDTTTFPIETIPVTPVAPPATPSTSTIETSSFPAATAVVAASVAEVAESIDLNAIMEAKGWRPKYLVTDPSSSSSSATTSPQWFHAFCPTLTPTLLLAVCEIIMESALIAPTPPDSTVIATTSETLTDDINYLRDAYPWNLSTTTATATNDAPFTWSNANEQVILVPTLDEPLQAYEEPYPFPPRKPPQPLPLSSEELAIGTTSNSRSSRRSGSRTGGEKDKKITAAAPAAVESDTNHRAPTPNSDRKKDKSTHDRDRPSSRGGGEKEKDRKHRKSSRKDKDRPHHKKSSGHPHEKVESIGSRQDEKTRDQIREERRQEHDRTTVSSVAPKVEEKKEAPMQPTQTQQPYYPQPLSTTTAVPPGPTRTGKASRWGRANTNNPGIPPQPTGAPPQIPAPTTTAPTMAPPTYPTPPFPGREFIPPVHRPPPSDIPTTATNQPTASATTPNMPFNSNANHHTNGYPNRQLLPAVLNIALPRPQEQKEMSSMNTAVQSNESDRKRHKSDHPPPTTQLQQPSPSTHPNMTNNLPPPPTSTSASSDAHMDASRRERVERERERESDIERERARLLAARNAKYDARRDRSDGRDYHPPPPSSHHRSRSRSRSRHDRERERERELHDRQHPSQRHARSPPRVSPPRGDRHSSSTSNHRAGRERDHREPQPHDRDRDHRPPPPSRRDPSPPPSSSHKRRYDDMASSHGGHGSGHGGREVSRRDEFGRDVPASASSTHHAPPPPSTNSRIRERERDHRPSGGGEEPPRRLHVVPRAALNAAGGHNHDRKSNRR